jgi:hypothetical protein
VPGLVSDSSGRKTETIVRTPRRKSLIKTLKELEGHILIKSTAIS